MAANPTDHRAIVASTPGAQPGKEVRIDNGGHGRYATVVQPRKIGQILVPGNYLGAHLQNAGRFFRILQPPGNSSIGRTEIGDEDCIVEVENNGSPRDSPE